MKKNIPLSILSGLLLWIAWPPANYTAFVLFFGMVPLLIAFENIIQSNVKQKGRKIFWTAFLAFFIWNTLSVYWVYNSLKVDGELVAIPVTLIPYSLGPILMAFVCWLYYRARLITKRGLALFTFACIWIAYEYLNQCWDLKFPWMTLGNGFAMAQSWIQWYEFTGIYGGSVWILILNILIFLTYLSIKEKRQNTIKVKLALISIGILVLPIAWSIYQYASYKEFVNPANVVIAQPNIDPYAKVSSIPVEKQIEILTKLSDSLGQHNTEFFIWPESAMPNFISEETIRADLSFLQAQRFLRKYKNGNIVTGVSTYKLYNTRATETANKYNPEGTLFYDSFNSAMNIENSAEVQFYHKSKLVPGAEALPFGSTLSFLKPAFEHLGGATGAYGIQDSPGVFYSQNGIGVVPVICYETVYGDWIAEGVHKGAQFIAIITNDGWWENTSGKDQHLDYAKLRAIETRRWVCQSANTGISAFINQRGDVVKKTNWWVKTAIKQDINLNSDLTFYTLHGDYIAKVASFIAILLIGAIVTLNFKRRKIFVEQV